MKNINIKIFLIIVVGSLYPISSSANNDFGEWKPQIVEKMFILPPEHLNKVLNNDFNKSILAVNLRNTNNKIKTNIDKIKDLNLLLPGKTDEEVMEIKHQIILHKRDYVKDMNDLLMIKKQRLKSKTMPNNILKSTAFYLSYGLAIDRIIKRQKQGLGDYALDIVLESSKEKYLKAISIDATAREAYYRLGKLETSTKIAHDWYDKALLHSPNGDHFVDVLYAKGNLYQRSGKDLQAIVYYKIGIKYEPNATDLRINCAISYRNAGELEKAKEMAKSILKLDSFHKKANWLIDVLNNPNI